MAEKPRLLDICQPQELYIPHPDGATLLPVGQLAARLSK